MRSPQLPYAAPLVYDETATSVSYPSRTLTFAVSVVGAAVAVQFLKRRQQHAEARQRTMAQRDPLTGVERIIAALGEAVDGALMPEGVDSVSASFAWAVAPYDTTDPVELFRLADARLLERKRRGRQGAVAAA
jgi:hypothetical protein